MPRTGQVCRPLVKLGKKPDDCWMWLGAISETGHARKQFDGKGCGAHRWIWEQLFGPIPVGLVVFSTCASKSCINPHHLACGTQAEANRQSVQTKLLPSDVAAIRAADRTPVMAEHLAARHDISANTVRDIWRGDSWGRGRKNLGPKRAHPAQAVA